MGSSIVSRAVDDLLKKLLDKGYEKYVVYTN
jgi:hypothetical protein